MLTNEIPLDAFYSYFQFKRRRANFRVIDLSGKACSTMTDSHRQITTATVHRIAVFAPFNGV